MVFYGLSDVGQRRQSNQDSFGYIKIADNAGAFIVCDGMGGANGGNIASELAVETFGEYLKNALGEFVDPETKMLCLPEDIALGPNATTTEFSFVIKEKSDSPKEADEQSEAGVADESPDNTDEAAESAEGDVKVCGDGEEEQHGDGGEGSAENPVGQLLSEAVSSANTAVYERSVKEKKLRGMGTTLVAALVVDNRLFTVSVGDSRIYMFCGGDMVLLTHDHSYVQYLIDIGQITQEQSLTNPYRNIITRAVGNAEDTEADTMSLVLTTRPTYILLCSDGLTNYVSQTDIRDIIWGYGSEEADGETGVRDELKRKAESLIKSANNGGGGDNITALIIKISD